jgi:hypothetical protein
LNWLVKLLLELCCHSTSVAPLKLLSNAVLTADGTEEAGTIVTVPAPPPVRFCEDFEHAISKSDPIKAERMIFFIIDFLN